MNVELNERETEIVLRALYEELMVLKRLQSYHKSFTAAAVVMEILKVETLYERFLALKGKF